MTDTEILAIKGGTITVDEIYEGQVLYALKPDGEEDWQFWCKRLTERQTWGLRSGDRDDRANAADREVGRGRAEGGAGTCATYLRTCATSEVASGTESGYWGSMARLRGLSGIHAIGAPRWLSIRLRRSVELALCHLSALRRPFTTSSIRVSI